jgi:antirestriction protein ArdC
MAGETKDTLQKITDTIVQAIEEGAPSYRMPWRTSEAFAGSPINIMSRRPYRGINVLALWVAAQKHGYTSGSWGTYRQWQAKGAQVPKGEKATTVVYWNFVEVEEVPSDGGDTKKRQIPVARDYWVFNAQQVDNYAESAETTETAEERIESAELFFSDLQINVRPGGNSAHYQPATDSVYMPHFGAFGEALYYYSVLAHETTHWTGAPHRLNRDLSGRFGSESYAVEELVAELGAAFVCAQLGLPTDPRTDHAPYIASWLKVMKSDKRAIFTAAAKAQQAVDWMNAKISDLPDDFCSDLKDDTECELFV